jgi:hypothetical protein
MQEGKITEKEYTARAEKLQRGVAELISEHGAEIFTDTVALFEKEARQSNMANKLKGVNPEYSWHIPEDIVPNLSVTELYRMHALAVTKLVLCHNLSEEELQPLRRNGWKIKALDINEVGCRTYVSFSNSVVTVEFRKEGLSWVPTTMRRYHLPVGTPTPPE